MVTIAVNKVYTTADRVEITYSQCIVTLYGVMDERALRAVDSFEPVKM